MMCWYLFFYLILGHCVLLFLGVGVSNTIVSRDSSNSREEGWRKEERGEECQGQRQETTQSTDVTIAKAAAP